MGGFADESRLLREVQNGGIMDKNQIQLFASKKTDDWATPKWLYDKLNEEFRFTFDPCPLCSTFDGLEVPWEGNIFVNPPYSKVKQFLIKAHKEMQEGRAKVCVFLVFSNTDTAWFHDYVLDKAEIRFLRGRIKFDREDSKGNSAMRPSMVCVFRA